MMKLATLKDGTRDGKLVVVSRDLTHAVSAERIAPTLQAALDDWARVESPLRALSDQLHAGTAQGAFPFAACQAAAPLPRAYQWVDASAFLHHGELMERAYNLTVEKEPGLPIMYQGAGDDFLGPCDAYPLRSEEDLGDFEGEVAVVLDDVPLGVTPEEAASHIKLLVLLNDMSLRAHLFQELNVGFGPIRAKPTTSFAPVAVTPDELGEAWRDGRVQLPLRVEWNGVPFGKPNGQEMNFSFPELIMHLARTRNLRAGTVLGSGTFSNREHQTVGSACLSERRAIELIELGEARTRFLRFGDRLRFEMLNPQGESVFGAIEQQIVPVSSAAQPVTR